MKVGCQSSASTAASNRPNCSSGSFQCAGAGSRSARSFARSTPASPASASLRPAWRTSDSRTVMRANFASRSTSRPA
jgi:hypothetical protein